MNPQVSLWTLRGLVTLAGGGAMGGAVGCSVVLGINGLSADRDSSGDGGGRDGGGEGGATRAAVSAGGGSYAIDRYEVTAAQYSAWLATRPDTAKQGPVCAGWNDSFEPGVISPGALAVYGDAGPDPACAGWLPRQLATGDVTIPVVCVDFCDAVAYCEAAGGHLCGKIGTGSNTYLSDVSPARGEWWNACSNGGAFPYPYGPTYQKGACNDSNSHVFDVGFFPGCDGGVPGVFDMSGNVAEWDDTCSAYNDPPVAENCLLRGGAFFDDENHLTCVSYRENPRGAQSDNTGFRCCGGT
jgi:formylglycine-generating enzyme required for sulfatase activity